jgi:hypothetical protein
MSRTRDISKVLSSNTDLVTTAELDSALSNVTVDLSGYLTEVSASTTYATQSYVNTIDVDNIPDVLMGMGG